ncbi:MAG: DUF2461 domain-containing protein [Ruminococcus sp.]|nr:DUF2461 domain-containing protein [Ruminococcus sp.]
MLSGFSRETFKLLLDIRNNNNKEFFEANKQTYLDFVYEPMKALGDEISAPFSDSGMIHKTGRIYRDAGFPPFLHYRDNMYFYMLYPAMYWIKSPVLYFELSPEGADFGFRISKPEAAVMERFRADLAQSPEDFLKLMKKLKRAGLEVGGEEYKRIKPGSTKDTEEYYRKKGLSVSMTVTDPQKLCSPELANTVIKVFRQVMPVNDMFHELVTLQAQARALEKEAAMQPEEEIVKAPAQDFMW